MPSSLRAIRWVPTTWAATLSSRIVYGSWYHLAVAFIGPLISLIVGVIYGSISGYFGGRVDNIMMRVVDVLYAFPSLLFIILLMAFFRGAAGHFARAAWHTPSTNWMKNLAVCSLSL